MTGFARADVVSPPFHLVWELRSVNHRFLDLAMRLPDELRALESACRALIADTLRRGKVECNLKLVSGKGVRADTLDAETLASLKDLQNRAQVVFPDARDFSVVDVLRWPGVLVEPSLDCGDLTEPALSSLRSALEALQDARRREGERLGELVLQRNEAIKGELDRIRPLLGDLDAGYRRKLDERVARLGVQIEPDRLAQELVLVAQRLDVSEEVDRLGSHVVEVAEVLRRDEPVGRRLDFLIQEMNREANTLGSKSQDETLTRACVELKVLIEQMREQVQNLE